MESGSKAERQFLENYVISPFPNTLILSALSELLPDPLWLVELKIVRQPKSNLLLIKGVSQSMREESSVQTIEEYLRALKEKFPANTDLVLTTSRQREGTTELTLFTAVFKWVK